MASVKAQRIPKPEDISSTEDILSIFCYYFPQYKYHEAKKLPAKRIFKMLKAARIEQAKKMRELIFIVSAPHTKKGSLVGKLTSIYDKIISGE